MKKLIITTLGAVALSTTAMAQKWNYDYAVSIVNDGQDMDAYEYAQNALKENFENSEAHYFLGIFLNTHNIHDGALSELDLAEKYTKDNSLLSNIYRVKADCYKTIQMYDKAIEYSLKAIQKNKKSTRAYNIAAESYNAAGDSKNALQYALKAIQTAQNEDDKINALMTTCGTYYLMEDYPKTMTYAQQCLAHNDDNFLANVMLAESHARLGNIQDAIKSSQKAFNLYFDYDVLTRTCLICAQKDVEETIKAINETYSDITAELLCCQVYLDQKQYEKALEIVQRGHFDDDLTHESIAKILRSMGAFEKAAQYRVMNQNNNTVYNGHNIFLDFESAGNEEMFFKYVDECIEKYPDNSYGYYRKGFHYYNNKEYDKAIELLETSIMLEPNGFNLLPYGQSLLIKGENDKAIEAFTQIKELSKDAYGYKQSLPFALFYLGDIDKAIEANEDNDEYAKACLYSLIGDADKAIEYIEKALENGYNDFVHIQHDASLDNIRNDQRFINLIDKHQKIRDERISNYINL